MEAFGIGLCLNEDMLVVFNESLADWTLVLSLLVAVLLSKDFIWFTLGSALAF